MSRQQNQRPEGLRWSLEFFKKAEKQLDREEIRMRSYRVCSEVPPVEEFEVYCEFMLGIAGCISKKVEVFANCVKRGTKGMRKAFLRLAGQQVDSVQLKKPKRDVTDQRTQTVEFQTYREEDWAAEIENLKSLQWKLKGLSVSKVIQKLRRLQEYLKMLTIDIPNPTELPELIQFEISVLSQEIQDSVNRLDTIPEEVPTITTIVNRHTPTFGTDKEVQTLANNESQSTDMYLNLLRDKEVELMNLRRRLGQGEREEGTGRVVKYTRVLEEKCCEAEENILQLKHNIQRMENTSSQIQQENEVTRRTVQAKIQEISIASKVVDTVDKKNKQKILKLHQLNEQLQQTKLEQLETQDKLEQLETAWKAKNKGKHFIYAERKPEKRLEIPTGKYTTQYQNELSSQYTQSLYQSYREDQSLGFSSDSSNSIISQSMLDDSSQGPELKTAPVKKKQPRIRNKLVDTHDLQRFTEITKSQKGSANHSRDNNINEQAKAPESYTHTSQFTREKQTEHEKPIKNQSKSQHRDTPQTKAKRSNPIKSMVSNRSNSSSSIEGHSLNLPHLKSKPFSTLTPTSHAPRHPEQLNILDSHSPQKSKNPPRFKTPNPSRPHANNYRITRRAASPEGPHSINTQPHPIKKQPNPSQSESRKKKQHQPNLFISDESSDMRTFQKSISSSHKNSAESLPSDTLSELWLPDGHTLEYYVKNDKLLLQELLNQIKFEHQSIVTNSQSIVTNSQPIVANTQPIVSNSQPIVTNSQPIVANSQSIVANSQSIVDDGQSTVMSSIIHHSARKQDTLFISQDSIELVHPNLEEKNVQDKEHTFSTSIPSSRTPNHSTILSSQPQVALSLELDQPSKHSPHLFSRNVPYPSTNPNRVSNISSTPSAIGPTAPMKLFEKELGLPARSHFPSRRNSDHGSVTRKNEHELNERLLPDKKDNQQKHTNQLLKMPDLMKFVFEDPAEIAALPQQIKLGFIKAMEGHRSSRCSKGEGMCIHLRRAMELRKKCIGLLYPLKKQNLHFI